MAAGDLLTDTRMRPYHSGHAAVARNAHERAGRPEPFTQALGERTWDEWLGERSFYQDPLYPYLVAAVYALAGRRMGAVVLLQGLLGLATVAMIFWLTRRLFGGAAAALAGLLAALYGPLIYYEALLLKPVLIACTGLAGLCLTVRALDPPAGRLRHLAAGLAGGVAFLAQSAAVLFVAPALAIVAVSWRSRRVSVTRTAGTMLVGFLLALAPVVARNLTVGAPPLAFSATGGWTFMNHNAEDYDPRAGDTVTRHAASIMSRTGGRLLPAVVETLRTQRSPADWPVQLGGKLATFWHWYEMPNNASFEYYRRQAPVSRLFVTFALVGPLAALGLALAPWRSPGAALAGLHVAAGLAVLVIFYQISRLRLPPVVAMIPFAAFGAVCLARLVRRSRYGRLSAALAATGVLAALLLRPLPDGRTLLRPADYGVTGEIARHLAGLRMEAGDLEGALRVVERQLAVEPPALRELDPAAGQARLAWHDAEASGAFAPLHGLAAELYAEQGRLDRAREERRRARVLAIVAERYAREKALSETP